MSCTNVETVLACFVDAGGTPKTIEFNTVYNADGSIKAAYYLDEAGAVVDTSVGTVTLGACVVASPDVEWELLCDVLSDGTVVEFFRRSITRFNADGTVIDPVEVADFEEDKITSYTVQGEVKECPACGEPVSLGLITDLSVL